MSDTGEDGDGGDPTRDGETADAGAADATADPTPTIRHLDERAVQRIAAGEVVERPASVVKELVENSLDADADRVSVAVEAGGTESIRVRDDGVGIPRDQLAAAVAEHATSKIDGAADLDAGVGTLGFRGEALYTVGAVSRLTLRSRPRDAAGAGAEITVEGGDVGEVKPAGCPTGTTVEVADPFYNTPARRKFLKTTATEFDHVNTVVTQYALANPDVAVSLEHDGREVFATEGNGDLRSAVLAVYGREVAEAMVDVEWTPGEGDGAGADAEGERDEADAPVERVHGLVSHPETTRAGREYLATFVNDRYVTAGGLRNAVVAAYGGQLAPDRYPFAVLFVEVPTDAVDVNVHPRKMEVRFDEEAAVVAAVEEAVEDALLDHGLIRSTAPRGRSAPDEARVSPESADAEAVGGAGTDHERAAGVGERSGDATGEGNADGTEDGSAGGTADAVADGNADTTADRNGAETADAATELDPEDADAWTVEGLGDGSEAAGSAEDAASDDGSGGGLPDHNATRTDRDRPSPRAWQSDADAGTDTGTNAETDTGANAETDAETNAEADTGADADPGRPSVGDEAGSPSVGGDSRPGSDAGTAGSSGSRGAPSRRVTDAGSQRTLGGDEATAEREYERLPSLRVLGQLHDTYVVAEAPDGLVLIDQHAADERVNYERLQREFADGAAAQALAEPVRVELTAREAALFAEFADDLAEIGFEAERDGERAVAVSAVPAVFDATLDPGLVRDVLGSLVSDAADGDEPVADVVDELLADLACYPSVTGNTSLTEGSVVDLLAALDGCENPYACPHGRPVVIAFDRADIEDRFERDYPGHAGRRAE
ncbi:hypothetical protein GCM10027435_10120 [Haloparvum alkalitolerans]|uniref:DNA mismatch repair endonuclease MutL n=1 Tax=Haloparvum alkalitolerans TaxID=1042953 RepID=UPI003CFB6F3F